jgi:very-short-patch-repair endonuclease
MSDSSRAAFEVDGEAHLTEEGKRRGKKRDQFLRQQGYEILRINGYRVTQEQSGVRKQIEEMVDKRIEQQRGPHSPSPSPPNITQAPLA